MSDDKKIKQAALGMGFRRHHRFLGLVVFGYPLCAAKLERCRVQYLALCHRSLVSAARVAVAAYIAVAARCGGRWFGGGLAGVALFAAFLFQTKGLCYTSASNASFITGLAVIITPLLAWRWLGIALGRQQLAGALLAAVGLAMLTLSDM